MFTTPPARAPKRRFLTVALGCALTATLTVLPAGPAHAASTTTCTGTTHVTFSPGLTFTPRATDITETDALTSCTSTDSTLTSGTLRPEAFTEPDASCNYLSVIPDPSNTRVHWNNGQTSTATLTYALTSTAGIVQETGTGTITAGEFTGATAVFTWIYAIVNPLQCLTPGGITVQDGTMIAQITGL